MATEEHEAHRCPVRRCKAVVPPDRLMCKRHWYMVPKPIRDRVWATYDNGKGQMSALHLDAMEAAINAVDALEIERGK